MSSATALTNASVKHRACDECRTRKLACSKDPDGCGRCKRENLPCHYSEQKPMGRPKKRQFTESHAATTDNAGVDLGHIEPLRSTGDDPHNITFSGEPYFTIPQDLGFDLLHNAETGQNVQANNNGVSSMWNFGGGPLLTGPPIDFSVNGFSANEYPTPPHDSMADISESFVAAITKEKNNVQAVTCSCLASMYLALSSLQQFPQDIVAALKMVRGAAATAARAIWCPSCGSIIVANADAPLDSFQNMMLLGTMLPIIANGYSKLLRMVDEETNAAVATGQNKIFQFLDYGGLCPDQETAGQAMMCMEKELAFRPVEMPPMQWRTTVRALLRVDIYGHEDSNFRHKGLKDLVTELELRQRTRHHIMDARLAAGESGACGTGNGGAANIMCTKIAERRPACLEILKMAKVAVDSLVIA